MPAIFFALISYFFWGTGVFAEAIVARRLNSYSLVFWSACFSVILGIVFVPFQIQNLKAYTTPLLLFNIALGLIALLSGTLVYFEALKRGNRALVGTIASSFPFVTVLASFLFLGERVSLAQFGAIFVIFTGLVLSVVSLKSINKKLVINSGIILAVVTMVSWGLYFAFLKIIIAKVGWFWPNYIAFALFPIVLLLMKVKGIKLERLTKNNVIFLIIFSTVLVRLAEFSYSLGISKGLVAIVAPIAGANPTLFVILAFFIFKDPITRQQIAGIITTLIGIVLLSVFSV
ncbi:MAG: DMT family transporter [Candidatus Daviesbacteria bacterium]|nr:DMT family transporter [Candidatus Daviesbacteria bacterium]